MVLDEVLACYAAPEDEEYDPTMEIHERVFANFMGRDFMEDFRSSVSSFNSFDLERYNILTSSSSINNVEVNDIEDTILNF